MVEVWLRFGWGVVEVWLRCGRQGAGLSIKGALHIYLDTYMESWNSVVHEYA